MAVRKRHLELIEIGKTYKNFKGNWREVIALEEEFGKSVVKYNDGTGDFRRCTLDSFRQWLRKQYY